MFLNGAIKGFLHFRADHNQTFCSGFPVFLSSFFLQQLFLCSDLRLSFFEFRDSFTGGSSLCHLLKSSFHSQKQNPYSSVK